MVDLRLVCRFCRTNTPSFWNSLCTMLFRGNTTTRLLNHSVKSTLLRSNLSFPSPSRWCSHKSVHPMKFASTISEKKTRCIICHLTRMHTQLRSLIWCSLTKKCNLTRFGSGFTEVQKHILSALKELDLFKCYVRHMSLPRPLSCWRVPIGSSSLPVQVNL